MYKVELMKIYKLWFFLCSQALFALEPRKEMIHLTVSMIIPCAAQHFVYLEPLLNLVANQTRIPNEVVVALSETKGLDKGEMDALEAKGFPYSLRLLRSEEKGSAGYNRNRACSVAKGKLIITQDADDLPHPQKVEIIAYLFEKYPIDHLLHTFVREPDGFSFYRKEDLVPLVFRTYSDALSCASIRMMNGQPSFTWQFGTFVKWPEEESFGEDLMFNRQAYRYGHWGGRWKCVVIDCPLIIYREELSTFGPDKG